jgi:hypothetical protein
VAVRQPSDSGDVRSPAGIDAGRATTEHVAEGGSPWNSGSPSPSSASTAEPPPSPANWPGPELVVVDGPSLQIEPTGFTGVTYRHPGLLAKIVTTLDVLSGGRAGLGIGAAWFEREHRGLGVPFPPMGERFERLEETLQICAQMWDPHNNGPFAGTHYQLARRCVHRAVGRDRRALRDSDADLR